jgi:hypothetical protein
MFCTGSEYCDEPSEREIYSGDEEEVVETLSLTCPVDDVNAAISSVSEG